MEENLLVEPPLFKLYKDRAVYVASFLGGPLAAGYLAAENFKNLGQPEQVKKAWLIAIAAAIVIFGSAFLIPGFQKIPNYLVPLIYSALAQYLVKHFQGNAIKAHVENGGAMYSTWRAVLIGIIALAVTLIALLIIILLTDKQLLNQYIN